MYVALAWRLLFGWYMEDKKPKEIIAKGHGKIYRRDGYDVDEIAAAKAMGKSKKKIKKLIGQLKENQ